MFVPEAESETPPPLLPEESLPLFPLFFFWVGLCAAVCYRSAENDNEESV